MKEAGSFPAIASRTAADTTIPPGSRNAFQPSGNVDCRAEQVAILIDHVADMHADAELESLRLLVPCR